MVELVRLVPLSLTMIVGDEDDFGAEDFEVFRSPLVIDFCLSAKENLGRCIYMLTRKMTYW